MISYVRVEFRGVMIQKPRNSSRQISLVFLSLLFALVVIHFQLTDCFEGKEGGVVKLERQREKRRDYDR